MSLSLSTSNFEPTPEERVARSPMPWGAIAFFVVVAVFELAAHTHQEWFADLAAWQWETKRRLLNDGQLNGGIAVIGSSILFHGLDPREANVALAQRTRVVNLALNGQTLQHSAQVLERQVVRDPQLRIVVLEIWNLNIDRESWLRGPYYRSWATMNEFLQSGLQYQDPSILIPFAAYRAFPTFRYREGLDNWIWTCLRSQVIDTQCLSRNKKVAHDIGCADGFYPSTSEHAELIQENTPLPISRPWHLDPTAEKWLVRIMETCRRNKLQVVLFVPPSPPFVEVDRFRSGYRAGFENYVAELRFQFPEVPIQTLSFSDYSVADFTDDHHFSHAGRKRLSRDFADWIANSSIIREVANR